MLWGIADVRSRDLGRWIAEAPGKSAREVVGYALDRWHEARDAAVERAERQEAESERNRRGRDDDAAALTHIGQLLPGTAS